MRPGWIACWAVLAYVLRFLSSWAVLAWTGSREFDPHGFGLLGDGLQLSAMAPPLVGLLIWAVRCRQPWRGLFAPTSSLAWTALSIVLLVLVGAPTLGQAWAIILLPIEQSWPVLASATVWFVTVAVCSARCPSRRRGLAYDPARAASAPGASTSTMRRFASTEARWRRSMLYDRALPPLPRIAMSVSVPGRALIISVVPKPPQPHLHRQDVRARRYGPDERGAGAKLADAHSVQREVEPVPAQRFGQHGDSQPGGARWRRGDRLPYLPAWERSGRSGDSRRSSANSMSMICMRAAPARLGARHPVHDARSHAATIASSPAVIAKVPESWRLNGAIICG